ncbi:MAG TPA: TetR/AcrR family transcriptional regulator [Thermodesulfovibrionales bacterium]|nr:TetR/AcrR family transcriptional regulator [Thermodesulfovibrionales bacterium]
MNKRSGTESRKKILNAALKVFSEYSYKGASVRMIARSAGVSVGAVYLYFRSKEALYTTLVKSMLDDLSEKSKELVKDIKDPAVTMRAFISMRIEYAKKHRGLILVQGREQGFTFGMKMKRAFFAHQRKVVEEIVRSGIAAGKFRKCDAGEVSKVTICMLRGFLLSIVVEPDALFSAEEGGDLILKGLLAKKEP